MEPLSVHAVCGFVDARGHGVQEDWAMTLRTRLMLLVLITMLPALAVIMDMAVDHHRHVKADIEQSALKFARFAVDLHAARVAETEQLLNLMADLPQVRSLHTPDCDALLQNLLFGNLHYVNFGVIRPDGMVACSGVKTSTPAYLGDRAYFKTAIATKNRSIGEYQIGRLTDKPVQVLAQPVLAEGGQVQSVVYAALSLESDTWITPLAELPPGSDITILDRHGVILTRVPDPQGEWTGVNITDHTPIAKAHIESGQAEEIREGRGVDGVQRVYALAHTGPSETPNGHIMVGIPAEEALAALNAEVISRVAFMATAFLGILALAWFSSEVLVMKRTRQLSVAARQMAAGNFTARAAIKGRDEIATLAAEFNRLGEALQENHRQIDRLNRVHEVLSGINGAILRIRVQDKLLEEACRIAVERGRLRFAWIGLVEPDSGRVVKMAGHGEGGDFVDHHCLEPHVEAADDLCPCRAAMPQASPVICNDLGKDGQEDSSWRSQARLRGFQALAGFPLRRAGKVIGVLGLYASEAHFFMAQEVDLFQELAADISIGLEGIDKDQRIAHLLYHDALTGLPTRTLCEDRLQQAILRARHHDRHVSVVLLNITDFHRVVGIHGHHVADEVLTMLATQLPKHVREGDTVARLGGDEFAIIYVDIASAQDAIQLAQALMNGLPTVFQDATHEIHLTIRAGAAIYPHDGKDAASLLVNATLATNSQRGERNHTVNFYSLAIHRSADEREKLEQALRHAIQDNRGLALHYQPVVDIHSYHIVSLEALARWDSAEFGVVSPVRFIPVAEETGLIVELGDWVLNTACGQIRAWREAGFKDLRVAINISFQQLRQKGFIERVADAAKINNRNGFNPLAIELTESELMDDVEATLRQIALLKRHDFTIYIDDFGTGYSSLSYLQRLPVDVLKIDMSFVSTLGQSQNSSAIVRNIIALAHGLKLKTIAEGVETTEQLALLREFGCDYAQGFLFSKPKPAEEITQVLSNGGYIDPAVGS